MFCDLNLRDNHVVDFVVLLKIDDFGINITLLGVRLLMYVITHFKRYLPVLSQHTDLCGEWSLDGFNELTNEMLGQIYELGIGYKPALGCCHVLWGKG